MGRFHDYELFDGVYHCFEDTQSTCYTSASASIYVPWSTTNAAAIISSISELSKYFAIYPLTTMNMKHNILLDVTIKANEIQNQYFFQMDFPPLLKGIQNMVAKCNESIQCPSEVTYILQMLNNKYGLDNIWYVCLKVLGVCVLKSFRLSSCIVHQFSTC